MPPARRRSRPRRRRGTGSVFEEGVGWRAEVRLRTPEAPEGQLYRHRAPTFSEAERWLDELVARHRGSGVLPDRSGEGTSLTEYATSWLALREERLAPTTYEIYSTCIHRWITPSIGQIPVAMIRRADVQRYVEYLKTTTVRGGSSLSWSSRSIYWRNLRTILRAAERDGLIARVPMDPDDAPRRPELQRNATVRDRVLGTAAVGQLSAALADALYACTPTNHSEGRCRAGWFLRMSTGIRQGEYLALLVNDFTPLRDSNGEVTSGRLRLHQHARRVPWEHGCAPTGSCARRLGRDCPSRKSGGMIAVPGLKSRRDDERTILLPSDVATMIVKHVQVLREDRAGADDHYLFGRRELMTYPERDRVYWNRLLSDAGVGGRWRVHDLRHTAISTVVNAGIPISAAQALAGHNSSRTTEGYIHADDDATRIAVEVASEVMHRLAQHALPPREIAILRAYEEEGVGEPPEHMADGPTSGLVVSDALTGR